MGLIPRGSRILRRRSAIYTSYMYALLHIYSPYMQGRWQRLPMLILYMHVYSGDRSIKHIVLLGLLLPPFYTPTIVIISFLLSHKTTSDQRAAPAARRAGHRIVFAPIYCYYCVAIVVSCRSNKGTGPSWHFWIEGLNDIIESNNNTGNG